MKAGINTSEFWLAVVSAILIILNNGLGLGIDEATVTNFANLVISYTLGRSGMKAVAAYKATA